YRSTFDRLFTFELRVALAVLALVLMALAVSVVWRRARPGVEPSKTAKHPVLEGALAVALFGLALFLVVDTTGANATDSRPPRAPALDVKVTAFQWCWRFTYVTAGFSQSGNCFDAKDLPTLVVPTRRPVELEVRSIDVVHELWVPYLRYKLMVFPGHVNRMTFTVPRTGTWLAHCSEFCGLYHDTMEFHLTAVRPGAFQRFEASRGTLPP
ncbi:MAG: cytochrome c oxidase subunit II, partial [Acidimicrobiales bacterium]|nr:cytochrome c oxidase subunit II [Acidimicrobiales bacterium]